MGHYFTLEYPAAVTVHRGGTSVTGIDSWGGGSLLVDLLLGPDAMLEYADALMPAPEYLAEAVAEIDVDARRLSITRDPAWLAERPALRRTHRRLLQRAWPGWEVDDLPPPPPSNPWVHLRLPGELPESAPTSAVLTIVKADGTVRDVGVGIPAEEALAFGPALDEVLADRPTFALGPEAWLQDGRVAVSCTSGALIDHRAHRISLWWGAPRSAQWATVTPLARLWPGYQVQAHHRGLPGQLEDSGRAPHGVKLDDAEAEALLRHRLDTECGADPVQLRARVLGALEAARAAGVEFEIPARLEHDPRPPGAPPRRLAEPRWPLPPQAAAMRRLAAAIRQLDDSLGQAQPPPPQARMLMFGPPLWMTVVLHELERMLPPISVARVLRHLVGHNRFLKPLGDAQSDDALIERARELLYERARQSPSTTGLW